MKFTVQADEFVLSTHYNQERLRYFFLRPAP